MAFPLPIDISGEVQSVEAFNVVVRQTGWETEIRQLDLHARPVHFSACSSPNLTLLQVDFPNRVHQRGAPPDGRLTFGIPSKPQRELNINGVPVSSESITCFSNGLDSVSEPMFNAYTISLDAGQLRKSLNRLGKGERSFRAESRRLETDELFPVRRNLSEALALASRTDLQQETRTALFENFERQLPETIVGLWSGGAADHQSASAGSRRQVVRRTMDLLASDSRRQCGIQDLCDAGACSQRTLERAYREQFGITPKQYLNRIRLAGVHRALLNAEEGRSIGDLAAHWGFWHLSQFAANYRAMFGELPSQTARRPRA
jgi:AraC-like DNA-binding protein